MKKFLIATVICLSLCLCVTGCGKDKEKKKKTLTLGEKIELKNKETVRVDKNTTITITQLGNSTCKKGSETCPFDGLKVEYKLVSKGKEYTKKNIQESPYTVETGKTDYKNFVEITVSKRVEE